MREMVAPIIAVTMVGNDGAAEDGGVTVSRKSSRGSKKASVEEAPGLMLQGGVRQD